MHECPGESQQSAHTIEKHGAARADQPRCEGRIDKMLLRRLTEPAQMTVSGQRQVEAAI